MALLMFDFLRRAVTVLRRPLFREPQTAPKAELVAAPVPPPRPEPTLKDLHERLSTAELRLHVSVLKTHRGATMEYHVGPADLPFKSPFLDPASPFDRTVSLKIPQRFQEGLRQHLIDSNTSRWETRIPRIGFIEYQFERFKEDPAVTAFSGVYQPKADLEHSTRGNLAGIGAYLEFTTLGRLEKMGVTHLRTSYQMVSEKRQGQLRRRGIQPKQTYPLKTWALHLSRPVPPRLRRVA